MATWPSTLPSLKKLKGFTETPPDVLIFSDPSAGPPKVRRRASAGVRIIKGRLVLTLAQVEILDSFFDSDLTQGSEKMQTTHPRTDSSIEGFLLLPTYTLTHEGSGLFLANIHYLVTP